MNGWALFDKDINRDHLQIAALKEIMIYYYGLKTNKLPFLDNSFDLIFVGEVIVHLTDTGSFASQLYRRVKPGGFLLFTTPISFQICQNNG